MIRRKIKFLIIFNLILLAIIFVPSYFQAVANSTCTITAYVGDEIYEVKQVNYGDEINLNELFSSPNYYDDENEYTLLNWVDVYYRPKTTVTVTEDLKVYAHFQIEKRKFTVTFKYNNGDDDSIFICAYGATKTLEDFSVIKPAKENCTFIGWYVDGEAFDSIIVKSDITVTAVYSENLLEIKPPEFTESIEYCGTPLNLQIEGTAIGDEITFSVDGENYYSELNLKAKENQEIKFKIKRENYVEYNGAFQVDVTPRVLTVIWSNDFIEDGNILHPTAILRGLIDGDICEFSYDISPVENETGKYICRVVGLTNDNYVLNENTNRIEFTDICDEEINSETDEIKNDYNFLYLLLPLAALIMSIVLTIIKK